MDNAECTALSAKCRNATTSVAEGIAAGDAKAWKSATDGECLALVAANCRCLDNTSVAGTRVKTDGTDVKCKTDFPDCFATMTLAAGQCAKPIAGYAYTSATDAKCATLLAANCRCADHTQQAGTRATGKQTCAAACTAASSTATTAGAAGGEGAAGEGEGGEGGAASGGAGESNSVIFALFAMIFAII